MFRFSIFYFMNMIILYIIFSYQEVINFQELYTETLNPIATFFINKIGIEAMQSGINIILPTSILKVLFGCNGLEAILIFIAAVLAYKADLSYKLNYLLQGIFLISVINIFRLVLLAYVIEIHSKYFHLMHDYVTQHIMVFLAILLFFIFVSNVKQQTKEKHEVL